MSNLIGYFQEGILNATQTLVEVIQLVGLEILQVTEPLGQFRLFAVPLADDSLQDALQVIQATAERTSDFRNPLIVSIEFRLGRGDLLTQLREVCLQTLDLGSRRIDVSNQIGYSQERILDTPQTLVDLLSHFLGRNRLLDPAQHLFHSTDVQSQLFYDPGDLLAQATFQFV